MRAYAVAERHVRYHFVVRSLGAEFYAVLAHKLYICIGRDYVGFCRFKRLGRYVYAGEL